MTTASNPIFEIEQQYGQSIWMDNLSRTLIESGELKQLIDNRGVHGITSNPSIFEKAILGNEIYDADIEAGIKAEKSVQEIYESLIFEDIRNTCEILKPIYDESNGLDGYVSIELPPDIALNTEKSIAEARRYYQAIDRPNVMVKIPGTPEGIPAVEQAIYEGIKINITLLFSVQSYIDAAWAYIRGLEKRVKEGKDISNIASVASFFLSRIDVKVDNMIDEKMKQGADQLSEEAKLQEVKGKVAIANAKVAYQEYKKIIATDRWKALEAKGANIQRLLWASTSTKNPEYSDVMYVDSLVGPNTVNTLPPETIEACADHCSPDSRIETDVDQAYKILESLQDPDIDINLDQVMEELLEEGIDKFIKPYNSLIDSLESKVKKLAAV
jgi:transaldolase